VLGKAVHRLGPVAVGQLAGRQGLVNTALKAGKEVEEFFVDRYSFASPVPLSIVRLTADMIFGTRIEVISDFMETFDRHDKREALKAFIGVETLVLNGVQDLLTPPKHSEEIVRLIPGAEHVLVKDAGHIIMLEHGDVVSEQLLSLIARAETRRGRSHRPAQQAACAPAHHRPGQEETDREGHPRTSPECPLRAPMTPESSDASGPSLQTRLRTAEDMHSWGARLGALLKAGDLLVLTGELGAGKTTLVQGIAEGLRVRGPITSPTYVIARLHPSLDGGPELVHVDAYRLTGLAELDDLDLDALLDEAVTVVEWGHGLAELLSEDYLEVTLQGHGVRTVSLVGHGARWSEPAACAALDDLVSLA